MPIHKDTAPKKILIVDDDEAILTALSSYLEMEGYQVKTAMNGQAAIQELLRDGTVYDLILLDLHMPIMNGWQFAHNLRTSGSPQQKKIPIVINSATDSISESELTPVFNGFIRKPFNLEQLLQVCQKY